jgi:DNA-binding response OmpR family regulator
VSKRVLVADTPDSDRRLKAILGDQRLIFARTLGAAQRALEAEAWDLLMIGVHFDDSRMFDLLRYLRQNETHAALPVVCIRSHSFASTAISMESLAIAARTLSCSLFLDLTRYPDDDIGNAEVRRLLGELLGT